MIYLTATFLVTGIMFFCAGTYLVYVSFRANRKPQQPEFYVVSGGMGQGAGPPQKVH